MIGACPHLVVAKSHIDAPVQAVLDTPMQANALVHTLSVRRQTTDTGAPLGRGRFPPDCSFGGDHGKRLQIGPTLKGVQTVKLIEDVAATHFDSASFGWLLSAARIYSPPPGCEWLVQCSAACMASTVTIQPSCARGASSSGIAVFSFDFSAVAR